MENLEPTEGEEINKLMTIEDVATRLNCSLRLVFAMKAGGKMPLPIKLGRLTRWDKPVIEEWIKNRCPAQVKNSSNFSRWKR